MNMPSTGQDRRTLQRFSIKASALVQTMSSGEEKLYELSTRDISSGGAFFPMEVPLPTGEKLRVTIFLSFSALGQTHELPDKSKIVTDGQVIRSEKQGIAVEFGKRYTMSPLMA
jgi:PilZ domain